jgi:hypothetical protein
VIGRKGNYSRSLTVRRRRTSRQQADAAGQVGAIHIALPFPVDRVNIEACGLPVGTQSYRTIHHIFKAEGFQEEYKVAVLRERLILPMVIFEPKNWK